MNVRTSLACVLIVASGVAAQGFQRRTVRSDQDTLIQLERDWDAAFLRKDLKFIESVLADEFISTYDDGSRGDKAKELALIGEFNQQIESSTVDEFTVKRYGYTAIVC